MWPHYQPRNTKPKTKSEPAPQQAESPQPASAPPSDAEQDENASQGPWKGLQYRLVGPFGGGRVVAVSGVVGQDDVYYFGAVSGGVWKSTDGSLNWKPLFDKTEDASPAIGALAVFESDPNVIYVATGEACVRSNIVGGKGTGHPRSGGKTLGPRHGGVNMNHFVSSQLDAIDPSPMSISHAPITVASQFSHSVNSVCMQSLEIFYC